MELGSAMNPGDMAKLDGVVVIQQSHYDRIVRCLQKVEDDVEQIIPTNLNCLQVRRMLDNIRRLRRDIGDDS